MRLLSFFGGECFIHRYRFLSFFFVFSAIVTSTCIQTPIAHAQSIYFPATGIYNGYLQQTNIIECENNGPDALNPVLSVNSSTGSLITAIPMRLEAKGTQHIILNDLVNIQDSYGTYTISLNDQETLKATQVSCRTAFYRASQSAKKLFDFSYAIPVKNSNSGELLGMFNSFNPSQSLEPTYNWLSIVNMDTSPLTVDIYMYESGGTMNNIRTIDDIAPSSRFDIALGHEQGQVTGTYRIVPRNLSTKYQAFSVRYGVDKGNLKYAFPLLSTEGSCTGNLIQLSTAGSASTLNWLEVANVNSIGITTSIIIRDRGGNTLQNFDVHIPAFSQYHINANQIIDPNQTGNAFGTAQILCQDPSDKLLAQSIYYGRSPEQVLEWAYASQDLGQSSVKKGDALVVPTNTYLGINNWLKLANGFAENELTYSLYDNAGQTLAQGDQGLPPQGAADLGLHELSPNDTIGLTSVTSSKENSQFNGELLRIIPDSEGKTGSIMHIPGTVQRASVTNSTSLNGDTTAGFIGETQSLAQYRDTLTFEEASHLLARTQFGATYEEIKRAQEIGLKATVEELMTFTSDPAVEEEARKYLDNNYAEDTGIINVAGTEKYWLYHMIHSPRPFKEKMALIWHDMFAASCRVVLSTRISNACHNMLEVFRSNALRNYGTIAKKMTRDYVMLRWLNGNTNRKGDPDENYAREFWELFSMGEASKHLGRNALYNSADIKQSARAFTGWTTPVPSAQSPNLAPVFLESRFDPGEKTIFVDTPYEASGEFNDMDIVDLTLGRPETAEWVVKRLFSALAHDNPSPSMVNELANMLRKDEYVVASVVRKILLSEALFSRDSHKRKVKDSLTYAVGFIRTTGIPVSVSRVYNYFSSNKLGIEPLLPPSVNGWPIHKYKEGHLSQYFLGWSLQQTNFIRSTLRDSSYVFRDTFSYDQLIPFPTDTYEEKLAAAEKLVEHWSFSLGVKLTQAQKETLVEYMHTRRNKDGSYSFLYFNPDDPSHSRYKITGLLWLLTQHEDYRTF